MPDASRVRRALCSMLLVFEALVLLFALLVAKDLSDVPGGTLAAAGGAAITADLVLAALLRHRWAYPVASVAQVLLLAAGLVVPVMYVVGGIFAGLWFLALAFARQVDRAARASG